MRRAAYAIALVFLIATAFLSRNSESPALQFELYAIEFRVSALRQLNATEGRQHQFLTREELSDYLDEEYAEDSSSEQIEKTYLFYRALDLGALGLQYGQSQIAGFYDADSQTMTIVSALGETRMGGLSMAEELTYAHEYLHVLQDQHFDFAALNESWKQTDDFDFHIAKSTLIEGDAEHVEWLYFKRLAQESGLGVDGMLNVLSGMAGETSDLPLPPDLPAIILEERDFIYFTGWSFVDYIQYELGWEGVNRAYTENPPETSEQIYHPQKYLTREGAIEVNPPDLSALIEEGWQVGYDNSVGEFYLRQHLGTQLLGSYPETLAEGWGGDRLQIFADAANEEMMWVWYQVWDSEKDAEEFSKGYAHFLSRRYQAESDDGQCWSGETSHCFTRVSETETRITMAPDRETARALLGLLD